MRYLRDCIIPKDPVVYKKLRAMYFGMSKPEVLLSWDQNRNKFFVWLKGVQPTILLSMEAPPEGILDIGIYDSEYIVI